MNRLTPSMQSPEAVRSAVMPVRRIRLMHRTKPAVAADLLVRKYLQAVSTYNLEGSKPPL